MQRAACGVTLIWLLKDILMQQCVCEFSKVRIPTHEDGSCLFWEFATEGYDIGFGVSFEWSDSPSSQLTVEVVSSDSLEGERSKPLLLISCWLIICTLAFVVPWVVWLCC